MSAAARRTLLVLVLVAVAAILLEGAVRLTIGVSLLRGGRSTTGRGGSSEDEARLTAAARTPGPYAADADPYVALRVKGDVERRFPEIGGAPATTDARGQRKRVGSATDPSAFRIVILGDSVAFGWGVRDDETVAHRLEGLLAGTLEEGSVRPEVLTVASPGWSFENARRYLLDHLFELHPQLVILLPLGNDLNDSASVIETGHRSIDLDPAIGPRLPQVSEEHYHEMGARLVALFGNETNAGRPHGTNYALLGGVTPESARRYAAMADGIADLKARLESAGARLLVALLLDTPFERRIVHLVRMKKSTVPFIPVFAAYGQEDWILQGDPHPNARCVKALAWRIAEHLIREKAVPGAGATSLPEEDRRYAGNRFSLPDERTLSSEIASLDEKGRREIGPRIDLLDKGLGYHQIYGGVEPDGTVGITAFAVVGGAPARSIDVGVIRRGEPETLHPLEIEVTVNGVPAGALSIPRAEAGFSPEWLGSVTIPEEVKGPFYEILLRSSNWVAERTDEGRSRLASYRLVMLAAR